MPQEHDVNAPRNKTGHIILLVAIGLFWLQLIVLSSRPLFSPIGNLELSIANDQVVGVDPSGAARSIRNISARGSRW